MSELRECPFCGGDVMLAVIGDEYDDHWFVTRGSGKNRCDCRVFMESEKYSDDEGKARRRRELVEAWNNRYERTCEMELQSCLDPDGNIFSFVCSGCGVDAYGHVDIGYCPNCGAKVSE